MGGPGAPPPPLMNLPPPTLLPVSNKNDGEDRSKLFDAINVGVDGIKAHLRKTNKDQLK